MRRGTSRLQLVAVALAVAAGIEMKALVAGETLVVVALAITLLALILVASRDVLGRTR